MPPKKKAKAKRNISAKSGKFISKDKAKANPETTVSLTKNTLKSDIKKILKSGQTDKSKLIEIRALVK